MSADERIPPLTAQQLGLRGPRSDDPGVGPDAARHTPPADDQAARGELADAEERARGFARHGVPSVDSPTGWSVGRIFAVVMAEYDRRGTELARMDVRVQQGANSTSWAAREAVAYMRKVDDLADQRDTLSGLLRGMARRVGNLRKGGAQAVRLMNEIDDRTFALLDERDILRAQLSDHARLQKNHDALADAYIATREALDHARATSREAIANRDSSINRLLGQVAAARALHAEVRVDDEGYRGCVHCGGDYPCDTLQVLDGPAEAAGLCPECGSEPDPEPLVTRPDMVECQHHCGAWVRPDADPAVTSALDWWHRRVREEEARRLASDTAAHRVLTEWPRMHPSGYLAMYPAMDALRAAVAAPRVDPVPAPSALALIDDLLRPWAYGYPVNPGYAGRAAQYVSVETLAGWNARRAALASAAAPRVEPALIGTWADESFVHHQDHKHPVEGCGYCPEEEDR